MDRDPSTQRLLGALEGVPRQLEDIQEKLHEAEVARAKQKVSWDRDIDDLQRDQDDLKRLVQRICNHLDINTTAPQEPRDIVHRRAAVEQVDRRKVGWIATIIAAFLTAAGAIFGTGK